MKQLILMKRFRKLAAAVRVVPSRREVDIPVVGVLDNRAVCREVVRLLTKPSAERPRSVKVVRNQNPTGEN